MARMERIIKCLAATVISVLAVALIMFVINNVIWLRYVERNNTQATEAVTDAGIHQQPDAGDHP